MTNESAVQFPTPTRVHVGLAVRDVPRDPDDHQWEVFPVTQADAAALSGQRTPADGVAPCCGPSTSAQGTAATEPTRTSEPPCCGPTCCQ